jgi:peptidoglycan glycosyltransferase
MKRELRYLSLAIIVAFGLVALSAAYWSVFEADNLLAREDNPRRVIAEQRLNRGKIVDRNGILLAEGPQGNRYYPDSDVGSAIGYYDYQFGAAGLEAGYEDILQGELDDRPSWAGLQDDLFHRPQEGYDIRSTIDLTIQRAVDELLGNRRGAGIVLNVPSGEILAMVSHPSFDPNEVERFLDENGLPPENLQDTPLFNRVRSGGYQPGGMMNLILLTGLLNADYSFDTPAPRGAEAVDVTELDLPAEQISCLIPLAEIRTLLDAFIFGCPQPFSTSLGTNLPLETFQTVLDSGGFLEAAPVHQLETDVVANEISLSSDITADSLLAEAIGQGALVINPLQMARFMSAIANEGNAPSLHMANAYRTDINWVPLDIPRRQPALLRTETAQQLKFALGASADLLDNTVLSADVPLYGYAATAFAGEGQLSWFAGFIELPDGNPIVVVIVIEEADDANAALDVALGAFNVASDQLAQRTQ